MNKILFCLVIASPSATAIAQWDLSRLRTLSDDCQIDSTEVDANKLTVKFSRFTAAVGGTGAAALAYPSAQCVVAVGFKVAAWHKLGSFTHRVFLQAEKNAKSRATMNAVLSLDEQLYSMGGVLPEDSVLNQKVLLYKSFAPQQQGECSGDSKNVEVTLRWELNTESLEESGRATLSLAGRDLWTDSWIVTLPCSASERALALSHAQIR